MSRMIIGSMCITDILNAMNAGHSAFVKGKDNGKIYMNVVQWQNDEPDQFGNDFAVQLSSAKEMREKEKKTYIGNLKYLKESGPGETTGLTDADRQATMNAANTGNVPVRQPAAGAQSGASGAPQTVAAQPVEVQDDLPF